MNGISRKSVLNLLCGKCDELPNPTSHTNNILTHGRETDAVCMACFNRYLDGDAATQNVYHVYAALRVSDRIKQAE
jgi:hypothetical protein